VRYPYTRTGRSTALRPYLEIFLRNGFYTSQYLFGLIDSGADYSLFPYELAKLLKIDLSDAKIWNFSGTTGKPQLAYLARVEINILGDDNSETKFRVSADVGFCPDFGFAGGALLGQQGFFSEFKTTFNQPYNFFEIEPYQLALPSNS